MRRTNATIERLRTIPLFASCSHDELALIASRSTEHNARAGDVLVREGQIGREFIVIVEGTAEVLCAGRHVASMGPGDFVGEIALLDGGVRTATVVAETDLVANVSSRSEFEDLIAGAPNLIRTLLVGVARRLRDTNRQLTGPLESVA